MINAPPPSEITQQSSLCSGSAIIRELDHVVGGDRIAVHRVRIEPGELAHADRDLGQLLRGRAVLVHVPLGGHRVGAHERVAVRRLVLRRPARLLAPA